MEALQRLQNRGSISTGYDITNSLKFEPDNTEYMRRSNGTDGNQRVFTQSMWIKRTELGYSYATFWCVGNVALRFDSSDRLEVWCYTYDGTGAGTSNTDSYRIYTAEKFRDTSAWYHVVFALDTTQGTESNRLKVYVNNERVYHDPNAGGDIYDQTITQNSYTRCNGTGNSSENWNQIGWYYSGNYVFAGYIAEVNFVDGLQLSPTDVAEYDEDSGIWKPKKYTGAYGTNGYYLKFNDASDLGADSSGNDNDMNSIGNIAAADQATDTPTNNFATGNPLLYFSTATTVSEGATKIAKGANGWEMLASTMAVTKGKWYVEVRNETMPESAMASIMPDDIELIFRGGQTTNYPGKIVGDEGQGYYSYNGKYYRNGHYEDYGASWTGSTNTIGIALDMDNGKLYFAKDNTWQNSGDPTSGSTGTGAIDVLAPTKPHLIGYTPYAANTDGFINFGGYTGAGISSGASDANGYGTFEYAPPSGYYALCTKNLEEYG